MVLNPSQIGQIVELKCQAFIIAQGLNVLVPIGNHKQYAYSNYTGIPKDDAAKIYEIVMKELM